MMDKKKRKKIVLIILLVILIIALLLVLGFIALIMGLQNSFEGVEFQMSIPEEPVRDFIVDTFEAFLSAN